MRQVTAWTDFTIHGCTIVESQPVTTATDDKNTMYHIRLGIKIFKALARLASNSKFLLAKSEKNSPKYKKNFPNFLII
jgi:hypothetical protein